ncbi:cell division cycle-associated 7-like protein [Anoplopoma fimbria]|uniref:cell division cycle-associated 7-like protein n=1 Tax=Anoplopoma fimbria TaxID=229290 RepID=UPI0023ED16E0|nr:cell division cycle-associated 7-like protein [Anoplopoma fimbria]
MTLTPKAQCFKSKFITAELARLFSQSDSEEEFEGFSEDEEEEEEDRGSFNKRLKTKLVDSEEDSDDDTGFYSDGDDARPPKRNSLLVAMRFPVKRLSTPKQELKEKTVKKPVKETPPSQRASGRQRMKQQQQQKQEEKEEEEEEEEEEDDKEGVLSQSLRKRDKNIQENKAMLAKLFADLSTMADLTLPSTPPKKKRASEKATPRKRKFEPVTGSERRNPSRKARPPENFAVEEKSEPLAIRNPRTIDIRRLVEVDEDVGEKKKKRRSHGSRRSHFEVRSVDDITQEELDNIAYRSKDKIWDKDNGSSCHQCRQKTLDTKTVCRSGFCVRGKGQFCGPCLKNRYGEDVCDVLLDPTWSCPICRDMCNCSLCRKKEGRCATGILVGLARYNGHDNVHEYLESIQRDLQ